MNIAQELSIVRDNIAEYGMTNITQLEYDAIYQQGKAEGRTEGRTEGRADAINAIKNDLHKRLTEEMNNPYQDQGVCQGLFYGIQRCDWYLDDSKEQSIK